MDNLTERNKDVVAKVASRTKEENESRLKGIEIIMKNCLDMGVNVPHEMRIEAIVILDLQNEENEEKSTT